MRELLLFDAAIQHPRVRKPRPETPRLIAERKKESVAFVMIVEFVHLYRRLRHAGQSRFKFLLHAWGDKTFVFPPDCAAPWQQCSRSLCRQQPSRVASH